MAVQALQCKECREQYPLEARYVCEQCFGPLEVTYDFSSVDADHARRKIQAGPQSIWRYTDFLPFDTPPKSALPPGLTPLVRADRLAERLGLREVWIKNDAANPTHSFKDRVVAVALAKVRELGFEVVAWRPPATWPTRSRRTRRRPGSSRTSSSPPTSRSRRSSPPASTARSSWRCAATTTTSTGSAPSCRPIATGRS